MPRRAVGPAPPRASDGGANGTGTAARRRPWVRGISRPRESAQDVSPPSPLLRTGRDAGRRAASIRIQEELVERIRTLRPHVLRESAHSDVGAFINTLRAAGPAVIRQPPMAAQNILVVLNKRNARVGELTRLIERDPALVHSLLRHANSAWYATGGSQPVVTVRGAIQRIGTNGVHATVMSSIMKGQLSRPGTEYSRMAHVAWEHMVRVAPLVRLLATPFGMDPEEVYTLGLLHDVGKLAFFDRIADLRRRKRRAVRLSSGFLEDALAILHEPLGGLACLQWGLSGEFAEAVASHHRSPPPEMGGHPTEVLYLAERLDLAWKQGRVADVDALWEEGGLTTPKEQVLPLLPEAAAPYGDVLAARVRAQVALPPEGRFVEDARQVMA